ncbi:MAG: hypothetical protein II229_03330 [Clostridia bacterium]|nr:hypothetical protein [Clostridia bacterium]
MLVKVITDSRTTYTCEVAKTVYLAPNFRLAELANNLGDKTKPQWEDSPESRVFVVMLQELRTWMEKPMVISSCYRQPAWNARVGGDKRSAHLHACAADWHIAHTQTQREHVSAKWRQICESHGVIGAINYYSGGYHLEAYSDRWYGSKGFAIRDYRGTKRDW